VTLNLSWITEELAIGGCFARDRVAELAREHRIDAVIDCREEACDDEELLRDHGISFLHLPTLDYQGLTPAMLRRGVAFAGQHIAAGRRVLAHCQHGIGRSALLGLCVLVARGHAPIVALALAKSRRAAVSPSPPQYEAWAEWLAAHRYEVPSFDAFAAIAYRTQPAT
jgi:protein-tyrosine phosphatase